MKNRKRIDRPLGIFIILSLISITLILSNEGFKSAKAGTLTFVSFFQTGINGIINFTGSTINSVGELRDLKDKYDELKAEVDEYRGIEREFLEIKRENIELKSVLDFNSKLSQSSIPCEVIGKDPSNLSSVIVINKGTKHGIKRNMPVVSEQNGIIGVVGKIISAGYTSSQVLPLLDESSYIAARFTDTRYEGLIKGRDSNDYIDMNYVQKLAFNNVVVGDLVETSGMNSIYPKGYYIGRVSSIKKVDYNTSLKVEVNPIIDFSRLEYLSVLKPEESNE